jgi:hypothetical protein
MSDDWSNFLFVMMLYIILMIYYNYLNTMMEFKNDWSNFKCNPIYMLGSSLFDPTSDTNGKLLKNCVNDIKQK